MGDIILGIILIAFKLVFLLLNKISKQPDTENSITYIIGFGAFIGFMVCYLTQEGLERKIGLLLFYLQFVSIILLSTKKRKLGYILLCITLLLQTPIINLGDFYYRSQTLFGFNIQEFPQKYFDVEPGSYVIYFNLPDITRTNELFPIGINLLSLVLFVYFVQRLRTWQRITIIKD